MSTPEGGIEPQLVDATIDRLATHLEAADTQTFNPQEFLSDVYEIREKGMQDHPEIKPVLGDLSLGLAPEISGDVMRWVGDLENKGDKDGIIKAVRALKLINAGQIEGIQPELDKFSTQYPEIDQEDEAKNVAAPAVSASPATVPVAATVIPELVADLEPGTADDETQLPEFLRDDKRYELIEDEPEADTESVKPAERVLAPQTKPEDERSLEEREEELLADLIKQGQSIIWTYASAGIGLQPMNTSGWAKGLPIDSPWHARTSGLISTDILKSLEKAEVFEVGVVAPVTKNIKGFQKYKQKVLETGLLGRKKWVEKEFERPAIVGKEEVTVREVLDIDSEERAISIDYLAGGEPVARNQNDKVRRSFRDDSGRGGNVLDFKMIVPESLARQFLAVFREDPNILRRLASTTIERTYPKSYVEGTYKTYNHVPYEVWDQYKQPQIYFVDALSNPDTASKLGKLDFSVANIVGFRPKQPSKVDAVAGPAVSAAVPSEAHSQAQPASETGPRQFDPVADARPMPKLVSAEPASRDEEEILPDPDAVLAETPVITEAERERTNRLASEIGVEGELNSEDLQKLSDLEAELENLARERGLATRPPQSTARRAEIPLPEFLRSLRDH